MKFCWIRNPYIHYEQGSMASVAGLMPMPIPAVKGMLDPDDLQAAIRRRNPHYPVPRLLCLETHTTAVAGELCRSSCTTSLPCGT